MHAFHQTPNRQQSSCLRAKYFPQQLMKSETEQEGLTFIVTLFVLTLKKKYYRKIGLE